MHRGQCASSFFMGVVKKDFTESNEGCVSLQWAWSTTHSQKMAAGDDMGGHAGGVVGGGGDGGGGSGGGGGNASVQPRGEPVSSARWGSGSQHVCHVCGYVAQRRQHLENHVRTHTGERPHQCPQCSYRCSDISNLKKHIRIHSGEKPFTCPHCSYCTVDNSSLKKHIRHHTSLPAMGFNSGSAMLPQVDHPWKNST